jgi:hypothetical protein
VATRVPPGDVCPLVQTTVKMPRRKKKQLLAGAADGDAAAAQGSSEQPTCTSATPRDGALPEVREGEAGWRVALAGANPPPSTTLHIEQTKAFVVASGNLPPPSSSPVLPPVRSPPVPCA